MADYISSSLQEEGIVTVRAGKKGPPQAFTQGGVKASGTWTFTGNVAAGDVLVVNGTTFTFVASGASGNQINVGVDLPTSLGNMTTVLNASAVAGVALATYTNDSTSVLTATYDTESTVGNSFTIAATVAAGVTLSGATLSGGQDTGVLSLDTDSHTITLTQSVDQGFSLVPGSNFQEKCIILDAKSTGNAVLTANLAGSATTCTFNTANDFVILKYMGGEWQTVVNSGCTIA